MKLKILTVIALTCLLHNRVEAAAPPFPAPLIIPQEKFGEYLVKEIMHGDTASVAPFFEDSVRLNLTKTVLLNIQQQTNWLGKFLGDSLEQFTSGTQQLDSAGKSPAFYREYRFAAESNKRSPLILVHVWFKDSVVNQASGAFVKTFLANGEKQIEGPQTWDINGKRVDINGLVLVQIGKDSAMMAIEAFDTDTARMDSTYVRAHGVPIVRKALAEGIREKARLQPNGKSLIGDIGVAFMRKDPRFGFVKMKFGITPREYMTPEEYQAYSAAQAPAKKSKAEKSKMDAKKKKTE